jgi:hypothetical protein
LPDCASPRSGYACVMNKLPPRELYQALAVNLRSRLDFAEHVLAMPGRPSQIVETVSLQGRKCVETIAYMMLVATEHGFGRANMPRDVRTQWNAEPIFQRLKRKGIDLIPSPQRVSASQDPRYKLVIEGIEKYRLNYDDLIAIYRTFHQGSHEPNPYVQPVDDRYYTNLLPVLPSSIRRSRPSRRCAGDSAKVAMLERQPNENQHLGGD